MESMSFVSYARVAEGYAKYRPYYHPLIMKKIRECTGLEGKFESELDNGDFFYGRPIRAGINPAATF